MKNLLLIGAFTFLASVPGAYAAGSVEFSTQADFEAIQSNLDELALPMSKAGIPWDKVHLELANFRGESGEGVVTLGDGTEVQWCCLWGCGCLCCRWEFGGAPNEEMKAD